VPNPPQLFTGKATKDQPAFAIRSPVDADLPWFDMDVPLDLSVGDKVTYQFATSADFSGATTVGTTLTSAQCSHGILDLAQSGLTDATLYYFRARYEYVAKTGREPYVGPWSERRSFTVAKIAVPSAPDPTGCGSYRNAASNGIYGILYGTDIDLGQPHAARFIFVGAGGSSGIEFPTNAYVVTDKQIAAGDFVGVSLTRDVSQPVLNVRTAALFSGNVPTGRVGRVFVIGSDGNTHLIGVAGVCVAKAYNVVSLTPVLTRNAHLFGAGDPFNLGATFDISAGQFAIAFFHTTATFASRSYGGSLSEVTVIQKQDATQTSSFASMAKRATTGTGIQASLSGRSGQLTQGVLAVYA
jgi:hypothetical protein